MLVRRKSSHAPTQLVLQFGLKPGRDRMHRAPKTSEVRDRAVNAGIRSGDERRHAFELARTEIMLRVGHRRELERGLSTWLGKILRRQRQCRIAPRARLHRGFTFRFWFAFAVNPALDRTFPPRDDCRLAREPRWRFRLPFRVCFRGHLLFIAFPAVHQELRFFFGTFLLVNWRDLGTSPGLINSDPCRADRRREPALKHMVNAVDGSDFSPESRFALSGLRLLFLVRLDDCLRRTFWRGLHARRGLTLWA